MRSVYVRVLISSGDYVLCFFLKQNTAYEVRISDWSSDVCSSDLSPERPLLQSVPARCGAEGPTPVPPCWRRRSPSRAPPARRYGSARRSEELRVGKECVITRRSRRLPNH